MVIVDDFSGYKIVKPLAKKSDAADALKSIIPALEKKYQSSVVCVRFDRDAVFLSNAMHSFFNASSIEMQPTSGYSPQENGHAERAISTLGNLRYELLADSGLKKKYWAEAIMHAAYLSNIMRREGGPSPWEILKNCKPDISNLRVWGCTCYYRIPAEKRNKSQLPAKAEVGKLLGYAQPNFKAFRTLLPSGKVQISRDVRHDESAAPASDARLDFCSDLLETVDQPPVQQQQPRQPPQQQLPQQLNPYGHQHHHVLGLHPKPK